jgi:hypothetical protein
MWSRLVQQQHMWIRRSGVMWRSTRIVSKMMVLLLPMTLSCSGNSFEFFADLADDSALYYAAVEALNKGDYDSAIDSCTNLSSGYLNRREARMVCASAFAGRCGFEILDEVTFLTTYSGLGPPPPPIFEYYYQQLATTTAADMSDCDSAEEILRGIGEAADRNDDENVLMTLLALHKIGVYANELADATEDNLLDGGFDACSDLTDAQAEDIAGAFWELNQSASSVTNSFFTDLATAIAQVCTQLNAFNATYNFCASATYPESPTITTNYMKGARTIIHEGVLVGVGSCGAGVPSIANCGCP